MVRSRRIRALPGSGPYRSTQRGAESTSGTYRQRRRGPREVPLHIPVRGTSQLDLRLSLRILRESGGLKPPGPNGMPPGGPGRGVLPVGFDTTRIVGSVPRDRVPLGDLALEPALSVHHGHALFDRGPHGSTAGRSKQVDRRRSSVDQTAVPPPPGVRDSQCPRVPDRRLRPARAPEPGQCRDRRSALWVSHRLSGSPRICTDQARRRGGTPAPMVSGRSSWRPARSSSRSYEG